MASSSGNGRLVFADSEGNIHLVNRAFDITTLNAFALRVCLVQMMQQSPLLVAIGVSGIWIYGHPWNKLFDFMIKISSKCNRKMSRVSILLSKCGI